MATHLYSENLTWASAVATALEEINEIPGKHSILGVITVVRKQDESEILGYFNNLDGLGWAFTTEDPRA